MMGIGPPIKSPTEDQALDYLIELLQRNKGRGLERFDYEIYIPVVAELFIRESAKPPQNVNPQDWVNQGVEDIAGLFISAAYSLCRLGILRPGTTNFRASFGQFRGDGQGYCIMAFGHRWIAEAPPSLPATQPSKATDMLHSVGTQFGDAYMLRSSEAVLAYNGLAYYACCAMVGAAAEAILLAASVAKFGESNAIKMYFSGRGRSRLQSTLFGNQPDWMGTQFASHSDLIGYWRDQAAHGHQTGITEAEAFSALGRLLRLAQFTADNWGAITTP
jgi:hypothetical protein